MADTDRCDMDEGLVCLLVRRVIVTCRGRIFDLTVIGHPIVSENAYSSCPAVGGLSVIVRIEQRHAAVASGILPHRHEQVLQRFSGVAAAKFQGPNPGAGAPPPADVESLLL